MFATYLRLHLCAGATGRQVIRAAARKLTPDAKHDRTQRLARHRFYRSMLEHHIKAQALMREFRL